MASDGPPQEFIEELVLSNPELGDRAWLSLLRWGGLLKATSLEKWMDYASRSRDLRHKVSPSTPPGCT